MSFGTPVAIINGIDKFGAKKLAELLVKNDIRVIGVGEESPGLQDLNNFEYKTNLEEIKDKVDYIFDLEESSEAIIRAEQDGAKLTIIRVNKRRGLERIPDQLKINWRIVNLHGVYGPGMERADETSSQISFLVKAIRLAVANKNLVLPKRNVVFRLLAVEDLTEVAMRASFLSGTEGEVVEVWGRQSNSEELARVLIDEAKMTRFKVVEEEMAMTTPDEETVSTNWKKLRWQPKVELKEGIGETMQYYFSKADEESRVKKSNKIQLQNPSRSLTTSSLEEREIESSNTIGEYDEVWGGKKRYEVVVDEDEKNENKERIYAEVKPLIETKHEELIEDELIEEEFEEIKPIIVKNSNNRPVHKEPDGINTKKQIPSTPNNIQLPITNFQTVEINKTNGKKVRLDWHKVGWGVVIFFWVLLFGVLGNLTISNYKMIKNTTQVKTLILNRKYAEATLLIEKTTKTVRQRQLEIEGWGLNRWLWGRRYQSVLKVMEQAMIMGGETIKLAKHSEAINSAIFKEEEIEWKTEMEGLKRYLSDVESDLGILQARLSGDWNWVPARWKGNLNDLKKQLEQVRVYISLGNKAVNILPEILGTDGKRREYMVLLQNESELRPGGGFIGSYGILSFENGGLSNFEIKDVYEADGQLKGHVEPPDPIKTYLGEAKWFMRDANWQADFGANSRDIQWFLEKETGRKVDGVIGVNLAVAKAMLGVVGEVYVPDFKEKINKNNLYEQAEFYSETKFFAGSNQKASFLGGLGKQLFEEIQNMKFEKRMEMMAAIIEMLEKNEIQIVLNNKQAATVLADLGWSGAVYEGKCMAERCFADYLYVVEANLGVNKANYFLYRNIDLSVDITEQSVGRVIKISYENTAKNSNWPGGDYKNYMRVYIPESSNLAEVSVTDGTKNGVKTVYSGNNLKINRVKGKKEIGFLVVVPANGKRIVEVRYVDQINLTGKDRFSYLHYIQKQSGYGDTGIVTLVSMPEEWQPMQVEPEATIVNGKLLFNQKLDRDIKMGVEIGR